MLYSEETKKRFVEMLEKHQILAIRCNQGRQKIFSYKFIGANDGGKWDFTPLLANYTTCSVHRGTYNEISILCNDGVTVVCETLTALWNEGICLDIPNSTKDDVYFKVREMLSFFYF